MEKGKRNDRTDMNSRKWGKGEDQKIGRFRKGSKLFICSRVMIVLIFIYLFIFIGIIKYFFFFNL